jgi:uncharacterized delta-60 repeat protein
LPSGGGFDPTFNPGGPIPGVELVDHAIGTSMVLEPDGRILVGGEAHPLFLWPAFVDSHGFQPGTEPIPGRFNADGSPDFTFQSGPLPTLFATQADGKIVALTWPISPENTLAVERFTADGVPDSTFNAGGPHPGSEVVAFDPGAWVQPRAVAVQADGKIVVLGAGLGPPVASAANDIDTSNIVMARFNPDGGLDTTFNASGPQPGVIDHLSNSQPDLQVPQTIPIALAIQPDGKILVGGVPPTGGAILVRYQADGSLDTSFGQGGYSLAGQNSLWLESLALQPDGKILAGGIPLNSDGHESFVLARYNSDGSLDTDFGDGGVATVDFGVNWAQVAGIALQSDGKILAVGTTQVYQSTAYISLARFNADGGLDPTFGNDGKLILSDLGGSDPFDFGKGIAVQPDGSILVVGERLPGVPSDTAELILVRLLPDQGFTEPTPLPVTNRDPWPISPVQPVQPVPVSGDPSPVSPVQPGGDPPTPSQPSPTPSPGSGGVDGTAQGPSVPVKVLPVPAMPSPSTVVVPESAATTASSASPPSNPAGDTTVTDTVFLAALAEGELVSPPAGPPVASADEATPPTGVPVSPTADSSVRVAPVVAARPFVAGVGGGAAPPAVSPLTMPPDWAGIPSDGAAPAPSEE